MTKPELSGFHLHWVLIKSVALAVYNPELLVRKLFIKFSSKRE